MVSKSLSSSLESSIMNATINNTTDAPITIYSVVDIIRNYKKLPYNV